MLSLAAIKTALSVAASRLPWFRKLNAERAAGMNPEAAQDIHLDLMLDQALKRLGANDPNEKIWTKAFSAVTSGFVRPEIFTKPHVQAWLSSEDIRAKLKKISASKVISADEIASDNDFLITSYMEVSGESRSLSADVVFTAVTFLSASIQADIRDPGTAAIVQSGFSSTLTELSLIKDTIADNKEMVANADVLALKDHSKIVFNRVSDNGAKGLVFSRGSLEVSLEDAYLSARVVLIAGSPGSGKSVLAKKYILSRQNSAHVFAFAAEELKFAHVDQVMVNSQVKGTWRSLVTAHMNKDLIFFIDGLERLLESEERGAFIDLINTAVEYDCVRIIITCRDYHVDTVEQSMLVRTGVSYKRVVVPVLTDVEMDEAEQFFPYLTPLFNNVSLRVLLRSPFVLARVAEINWPSEQPLPKSERALREHLWRQVVKKDAVIKDSLPSRRANTLTDISLARAKSLQSYIAYKGDNIALDALALDSLIVADPSGDRFAPAHDVFEDWALIEWLDSQFVCAEGNAYSLAESIGSYPALRRAYRKWLHEMLEVDPARCADFLEQVTTEVGISEHFKDDTLISIFQSSQSESFLDTFGSLLLSDDAKLLIRVIHLVRVACKTASPLSNGNHDYVSFRVPSGEAWPTVLRYLANNWNDCPQHAHVLVLGLIEDWSAGINWITPYPAGADAAGRLLENLLSAVEGGYGRRTDKQRVIDTLIKFPKSVDSLFLGLVERALAIQPDDDAEMLIKAMLKPLASFAACRDYPDQIIMLFTKIWQKDKEEIDASGQRRAFSSAASAFGITEKYEYKFSIPSANQGPFLFLLRTNPIVAIKYINKIMNDATSHYAKHSKGHSYATPLATVKLVLPDGTSRELFCNEALWRAYRGNSSMPAILQSALMALEKWLLECVVEPKAQNLVHSVLEWLLKNTNNAALASVVASVCIAHPGMTGEAALGILGCKEFFFLDLSRCSNESFALAMGGFSPQDRHFQQERFASNKMPHRSKSLEDLALDLQLTEKRDAVFKILDRHRAELPSLSLQSEQDKVWRLSMIRMDQREYEVKKFTDDGYIIGLKPLEKDIQQVVDEAAPRSQKFFDYVSLSNWAHQQFERDPDHVAAAQEWPQIIIKAQQQLLRFPSGFDDIGFPLEAPNVVAAICVRDNWNELSNEDRNWCLNTIFTLIAKPLASEHAAELHAKHPSDGSGACATVLALILSRDMRNPLAVQAIINGLLHFNETVRFSTLQGIAEYIVGKNTSLTYFCVNVVFLQKNLWSELVSLESKRPWNQRSNVLDCWKYILTQVSSSVDESWYEVAPKLEELSFDDAPSQQLVLALMKLYCINASEELAFSVFSQVALDMARRWGMSRRERQQQEEQRNYQFDFECEVMLSEFLVMCDSAICMSVVSPMLEQIENSPQAGAKFLVSLIIAYDKGKGVSTFWAVWAGFTRAIRESKWLSSVDSNNAHGRELLSRSFFNIDWNEGIRTWSKLGSHYREIDDYFVACGSSSLLLGCYVEYLYKIGESSLPNAFVLIVDKYDVDLFKAIGSDANISWHLESVLSRVLFENLSSIKGCSRYRVAIMFVLDALVQCGSSVAFQLRDDFVTPAQR